jgi:hypothetical protein
MLEIILCFSSSNDMYHMIVFLYIGNILNSFNIQVKMGDNGQFTSNHRGTVGNGVFNAVRAEML